MPWRAALSPVSAASATGQVHLSTGGRWPRPGFLGTAPGDCCLTVVLLVERGLVRLCHGRAPGTAGDAGAAARITFQTFLAHLPQEMLTAAGAATRRLLPEDGEGETVRRTVSRQWKPPVCGPRGRASTISGTGTRGGRRVDSGAPLPRRGARATLILLVTVGQRVIRATVRWTGESSTGRFSPSRWCGPMAAMTPRETTASGARRWG
jgi:hypothetical protein